MKRLSFDLEALLDKYGPISFAVGYGSGVFKQENNSDEDAGKDKPLVDLLLVTNDTNAWHTKHTVKNKKDYSWIRRFGKRAVNFVQNWFPGLHYHPYVDFNGKGIKYGVISRANVLKDLRDWSALYVAGRLHKPVEVLVNDPEIEAAMQDNLRSAVVAAALLRSNEVFDERELYKTISKISYMRAARHLIWDVDPNKIDNIVNGSFDQFKVLYADAIEDAVNKRYLERTARGGYRSVMLAAKAEEAYDSLPANLKRKMPKIKDFYNSKQVRAAVETGIKRIVFKSSFLQGIKGGFTTKIRDIVKYVARKRRKGKVTYQN